MPTRVRSYSKINLGLAIGQPRPDGFHSLSTLYQTLALHDMVTVSARAASQTRLALSSNDPRVPCDGRNTAWEMVEKSLAYLDLNAQVEVHIRKNLPIQGGMGAGSANAAAALIGLERELQLDLSESAHLDLAAQVGSDVPLFLVGGSVLGSDRGQVVQAVADVTLASETEIPCVIALPRIGVSTPLAFREWDKRLAVPKARPGLHDPQIRDTIEELRPHLCFRRTPTKQLGRLRYLSRSESCGSGAGYPLRNSRISLVNNVTPVLLLQRTQTRAESRTI